MNQEKYANRSLDLTTPAPFPRPTSPRSRQIVDWFGLPLPEDQALQSPHQPIDAKQLSALLPQSGQIVLISGASGAGKSSLLGAIRSTHPDRRWIDLRSIRLPDRALVDCFGALPMRQILRLLSEVGLAEAWTYLRSPKQLSDGQRWRLRLAKGLARSARKRRSIIICDEFCALLDRVTAAVVARSLRRATSSLGTSAIVATSHEDLRASLKPDLLIQCDFGKSRILRSSAPVTS